MQVKIDIAFDQLVSIAKGLPKTQWQKLKIEVERKELTKNISDLESLLLSGPVFTEEQIDTINETRKAINTWRTKKL